MGQGSADCMLCGLHIVVLSVHCMPQTVYSTDCIVCVHIQLVLGPADCKGQSPGKPYQMCGSFWVPRPAAQNRRSQMRGLCGPYSGDGTGVKGKTGFVRLCHANTCLWGTRDFFFCFSLRTADALSAFSKHFGGVDRDLIGPTVAVRVIRPFQSVSDQLWRRGLFNPLLTTKWMCPSTRTTGSKMAHIHSRLALFPLSSGGAGGGYY